MYHLCQYADEPPRSSLTEEQAIAVILLMESAVDSAVGRDHWPAAGFVLLAGGGFKTAQYVGETSTYGESPKSRPYTPQNLLATLYSFLGINPATTIPNSSGRPMYLLDQRRPIHIAMVVESFDSPVPAPVRKQRGSIGEAAGRLVTAYTTSTFP